MTLLRSRWSRHIVLLSLLLLSPGTPGRAESAITGCSLVYLAGPYEPRKTVCAWDLQTGFTTVHFGWRPPAAYAVMTLTVFDGQKNRLQFVCQANVMNQCLVSADDMDYLWINHDPDDTKVDCDACQMWIRFSSQAGWKLTFDLEPWIGAVGFGNFHAWGWTGSPTP